MVNGKLCRLTSFSLETWYLLVSVYRKFCTFPAKFPLVHQQTETTIPADILLVSGTCIVNEAMLSGESTPLLKESIQLLEGNNKLDVDGTHKGAVLFSGTKVLQAGSAGQVQSGITTPDSGCLGVVLRTGFGTAQGQLVRTMIFSTERVSANNVESFLFIGFLLIFAIAASWYVWVKGEHMNIRLVSRPINYYTT